VAIVRDPRRESPSPVLLTRLEMVSAAGQLSEATGGIAVAPEHTGALSGFVKAERPTEGKEEATDASGRPADALTRTRKKAHRHCRRS
jgi:hypothetical protein